MPQQFDLFGGGGFIPAPPASPRPAAAPQPETLDDDTLIAAIPDATQRDCRALTREAARRRLTPAIPALVALCRRFRGFGLTSAVAEQLAAVRAMAAIGGRDAAAAVVDLLSDGSIQGPGLAVALEVAATLQASLPAALGLTLLRDSDPWIRAAAARCTRTNPEVIAMLADLLTDLNADVSSAAAHALGRAGEAAARPALFRLLAEFPSAETIAAIAPVADEAVIVLLGRIARAGGELADQARDALEDIDHPRAAAVLRGLGRP